MCVVAGGVLHAQLCCPVPPSHATPPMQVVLCFEERFWDSTVHLFGHVATSHTARGEFFLFWHLSETPVRGRGCRKGKGRRRGCREGRERGRSVERRIGKEVGV